MKTTIHRKLNVLIALNALLLTAVVALGGWIALDHFGERSATPASGGVSTIPAREGLQRSTAVSKATENPVPEKPDKRPVVGAGGVRHVSSPLQPLWLPRPTIGAVTPMITAGMVVARDGTGSQAVSTSSTFTNRQALDSERGPSGNVTAPSVWGSVGVAGNGGSGDENGIPGVDAGESSDVVSSGSDVIEVPKGTNSIPAAFEEMESDIANDPAKREAVEEIRDEFVRSISNPDGTIPTDIPLNDWLDAQWIADERYRMRFGHEAWNAQQRRAAKAIGEELLGSE